MLSKNAIRTVATVCALAGLGLVVGCGPKRLEGFDAASIQVKNTEALTGTALIQRKVELQRALSDMGAFNETMEGMIARRDRSSVDVFSGFVRSYLTRHLSPMLRGEWQAKHPELVDLDVNLRISQTDLMIQMRKPQAVKNLLKNITRLYQGRSLLIDYPAGRQSTVAEAVEILNERLSACLSDKSKWGPGAQKRDEEASGQSVCMGPA